MDDVPKGYSAYYGGAYLLNKNNANQSKDVLPKSDVVQKSDTPETIIRDTFDVAEAENIFPARRVHFTEQWMVSKLQKVTEINPDQRSSTPPRLPTAPWRAIIW